MQIQHLLAGSPLLAKANEIVSAAEATWQELRPLVLEAEQAGGSHDYGCHDDDFI